MMMMMMMMMMVVMIVMVVVVVVVVEEKYCQDAPFIIVVCHSKSRFSLLLRLKCQCTKGKWWRREGREGEDRRENERIGERMRG